MAQFMGVVRGTRGEGTRLGTKNSGMIVEACSWQGKVIVRMTHDETAGVDMFTVDMEPHHGRGDRLELVSGVVGDRNKVSIGGRRELQRMGNDELATAAQACGADLTSGITFEDPDALRRFAEFVIAHTTLQPA